MIGYSKIKKKALQSSNVSLILHL